MPEFDEIGVMNGAGVGLGAKQNITNLEVANFMIN